MRHLFLIILFSISIFGELNKNLLGRVNPDNICRHISTLADDSFQGRKPNTLGEQKTINYVIEQYKNAGLLPGNNGSWLQEVPLADITPIPPESILLSNNEKSMTLNFKEDYILRSPITKEKIEFDNTEIVFVGFGINAPELNWNDYEDVDVKGKIVIVLNQFPGYFGADSTLFDIDEGANLYAQSFYKKNEAARQGARGIFFVYEDQGPVMANWSYYQRTALDSKMELYNTTNAPLIELSGVLTPEAMKEILRFSGYTNFDYTSAAIKKDFKALHLNVGANFQFNNKVEMISSYNIVGKIVGSKKPEEVIIYTAHWDHEGINQPINGDSVYNGAVDNASGVAGIIEVAQAFNTLEEQPERSILFIATTAEEMGLLGAVHYNRDPIFSLSKTAAVLNLDAHHPYGRTSVIFGVVYGRSELDNYMERSAALQSRKLVKNPHPQTNVFFRSDHYPFVEKGIPGTFAVGSGGALDMSDEEWNQKIINYVNNGYHQPTDEYFEEFDCRGIAQDAEFVFLIGWELSNNSDFPQWNREQPFYRIRKNSIDEL